MNVGRALSRLRGNLRQPTDFTWDRTGLLNLLEEAQAEIFFQLLAQGVPHFVKGRRFTWPADLREMLLTDALGRSVAQIRYVGSMANNADPSRTNVPIEIAPLFEASEQGMPAQFIGDIRTQEGDSFSLYPTRQGYWAVGNRIMMSPVPATDMYIWFEAIFDPPSLDTDDVELLDGELPGFHYLVILAATLNAISQTADSELFSQFKERFERGWEALRTSQKMARQNQRNFSPAWIMAED